MAEINTNGGRRNARNPIRVDLTPMVDLGFLLICFFVFTHTLSESKAMRLILPKDSTNQTPIAQSGAITLIALPDKIMAYQGNFSRDSSNFISFDYLQKNELRQWLIAIKHHLIKVNGNDDKLMVLIKPSEHSVFQHTIALLDELTICAIKRYALLETEQWEQDWLAQATVVQ